MPDASAELEFGYRYEFGNDMALGIAGVGKYSNEWRNEDVDMRRYEFSGVEGGSTQTVDFNELTTTQSVDVSGFVNLGWEISADHQLSLMSVILRQTNDTLEQRQGLSSEDDVSDGTSVETYLLQWEENEIRSQQFTGEHYLPFITSDSVLNWRYVRGSAQRDAPDTRSYSYAANNEGLQEIVTPGRQAAGDLRDVFSAPDRVYNKQDDTIEDYGLDLEIPFFIGDKDFIFKAGAGAYQREREVEQRTFRFDMSFRAPLTVPLQTPDQLFRRENWQNGYLTVRDFSGGAADAAGIYPFAASLESVDAVYAGIDAQVSPRLRVQVGARWEDAALEADAWGGNTQPGTENAVEQGYEDVLPAASLTFEIVPDMQIRFAYSETVNRPSLLEITGSTLRNPEDGYFYRGNVFLEQAELENYDVRWEWYFGGDETMSLGLFYKAFTNPIELGKVLAQGDIYTWFNAEEAELRGVEYELRKALWFGDWFGWDEQWNNFTLTFNASYIESEVTLLGEGETGADVPLTAGRNIAPLFANERPLTGQSDWLGNVALAYESDYLGLKASLAYNYTGERVALVGERSAPDILEAARGQLDFSLKYAFQALPFLGEMPGREWELALKAGNLLNEESTLKQGDWLFEEFRPGVEWGLGLKARF